MKKIVMDNSRVIVLILKMKRVVPKSQKQLLNIDKKNHRMSIGQELLNNVNNFLGLHTVL